MKDLLTIIFICLSLFVGCSSEPQTKPNLSPSNANAESASSPKFDAVLQINAAPQGVEGPLCTGDMAPNGQSKCGPPESLSQISWEFLEHRDGKDYYQFDWRLTNNGEMISGKGQIAGFDGDNDATVIDAQHHIVIKKGPLKKDTAD